MDLFDSHSHLDAAEFDSDRQQVLQRARAAGVTGQLVPAVDAAGWGKLREICHSDPGLHAAYGLHPLFLASHRPEHLKLLPEWIDREKPVAIGECGLDFFIAGLDAESQRRYFRQQLGIAREFALPVVIHARRAVEEVIMALRAIGGLSGVIHSYPGSEEQARQLMDMGFALGIGGPVTYERANRLRRLVSHMPLHWLLLETDSPDQPGAADRGQRNEPARLLSVMETVAALREVSVQIIARASVDNARRIFRLPAPLPD